MAAIEIETSLRNLNAFGVEDFETASIRSAAPSYVSEVPSYHTTVSTTEPIPPYSPPQNNNSSASNSGSQTGPGSRPGHAYSVPTLLPSDTAHISSPGLPPIPAAPRRSTPDLALLGTFRIPSWSTVNTNPMYQRVANRRAQAAMSGGEGLMRNAARVLDRVNEEASGSMSGSNTPTGSARLRPLEDPYLVGEEAAARARSERLARENGVEVLDREDRRWDWFLTQMKDWDEREVSWKAFRRDMATGSRGKLARRIGAHR